MYRLACCLLLCVAARCAMASSQSDMAPPVDLGANVKVQERPKMDDDPEAAWDEWDEDARNRHNAMPRRQRGVEQGMSIDTILGQVMRQEKVLYAYLRADIATNERIGKAITTRYFNMMAGGGTACKTWYVHNVGPSQRQIVLKCETVRDGHDSKNFLLKQPEVEKVNLDNLDFTPKPQPDDDDDDDDVADIAKQDL